MQEALAPEPQRRVLTLAEALATARDHQPALRVAEAEKRGAEARVDVARADWLPQLNGTASLQRMTGNFVARPGAIPRSSATAGGSTSSREAEFDFYRFYSFGVTGSQLVYDFGQTGSRLKARKEDARAERDEQQAVTRNVSTDVRRAFFAAQALKALIGIARASLANHERHLAQVQAFVEVGTRPEIDLAQQRADTANARVAVMQSENAYELARVTLNQAMGVERGLDYDVADDKLPSVEGEDLSADRLWEQATEARSELAAADARVRARELSVTAAKAGHAPSLGLTGSATLAGTELARDEGWNFAAGAVLTVPLVAGGRTLGQVREAEAQLYGEKAARDALRQALRVQLEDARLLVLGQKAVLEASVQVVEAARTRLTLAEGRYEAGVGSIIELGDAQLALVEAEAQLVQAEFRLSSARAELMRALGRDG